jgi:hypothetical protein
MTDKKLKSIILHGGIGNQLFQWSFGHYLYLKGFRTRYVFFEKPYSLLHASESLGKFLDNCPHGNFQNIQLPSNRILAVLKDPSHQKSPKRLFPKLLSNTEYDPFFVKSYSLKEKYHLGYFQNHEIVSFVREAVVPELMNSLFSKKSATLELENELSGAQVIHVRQGDTMTTRNMGRVGVLSSEYYADIPKRTGVLNIVLTDDPAGAKKIIDNRKIDAFLGPEELDVAATLRVMAHASSLYAANSTLAWWGGILAQSKGAEVHIPKPFFRNVNPRPGHAFDFPGFKFLESKFMEIVKND